MTALQLSKEIKSRKIGVAEAAGKYIALAQKNVNNAFIPISEAAKQRALAQSEKVQKQIDSGAKMSDLAGVPIAIKDNISTVSFETTCASKMLENYVPVFNASVIDRLEKAGMVVVAKLNMDEFAMGGSSETGAFGAVRNPWDAERVAGGSSGGSAAAVAGGEIPLSLGSDTGGSIRQPCSFCSVTGIKPTYGAVSRYGLVAFASSLDQIGTLGKNIDDSAALLSIISGSDSKDGTCVIEKPFDFSRNNNGENSLNGIKIGLPLNYFENGIDGEVKKAVLRAAEELKRLGAKIEEFNMPYTDYAVHTYYILACAEASSNLSRYDGMKYGFRSENAGTLSDVYLNSRSEGFGLEVKRRIMLGSFVLSSGFYDSYYKKALQTRQLVKQAYNRLFREERFDMLLSPVAPTAAYKIGENLSDPLKMYMGDIYTVSVNLAGLPAVSLPCGFTGDGLPIGLQLIGDSFAEEKLVGAARVYQNETDYHKKTAIAGVKNTT